MGRGRDKLTAATVAKHTKPGYLLDGVVCTSKLLCGHLAKRVLLLPWERTKSPGLFDTVTASPASSANWAWGPWQMCHSPRPEKKAAELRGLLQDGKDPMTEKAAGKAAQRAEAAEGDYVRPSGHRIHQGQTCGLEKCKTRGPVD